MTYQVIHNYGKLFCILMLSHNRFGEKVINIGKLTLISSIQLGHKHRRQSEMYKKPKKDSKRALFAKISRDLKISWRIITFRSNSKNFKKNRMQKLWLAVDLRKTKKKIFIYSFPHFPTISSLCPEK